MNPLALVSREAIGFLAFLTAELTAIYLAVVFLVEVLQSRLGPDRLRRLIGERAGPAQFLVAAGLGAVTPFCSCSTVPMVAGMERAGVPWPVLGSFLVISPLVNPALFALMWTFVGLEYALLYVLASLVVAVLVGAAVALRDGDARAPSQSATPATPAGPEAAGAAEPSGPGWDLRGAGREALDSTVRMLPIFVGAGLIGITLRYGVGTDWIEGLLAGTGWWGIPLAAVVGLPVYASTAVLLPLGALLLQQGVNLGVVTAFLMGATGFSVPEGVMLKEIVGTQRLTVLAVAFSAAVVAAGYGFQLVGI